MRVSLKIRTGNRFHLLLLLLLSAIGLLIAGCDLFPQTALERVMDRGELRVLTRNSATTFYEGPDGASGLEYELAAGFADFLGVELSIEIPDTFAELLETIRNADADLAAAGLTITPERTKTLNFGPVYQHITAQLVYRSGNLKPADLGSVHGSLEVVADSSHAERLSQLQMDYPELSFTMNPDLESEELLRLVWEQILDYTVADSNEIATNQRFYPELRIAFDISPREPLAWAFPAGKDHSLIDKAEEYFAELTSSGRLEQLLERYYGHISSFDYVATRRYIKHIEQRLPRYKTWFEQAAEETDQDWRLLAAIGYQESHWDPNAVSPTGVRGIMMLTKAAMKQLDMSGDRVDARTSIFGGARYIHRSRKKIPARIAEPDRTWMALAAYNIGYGHLEDARILTENAGDNPDLWVDVKKYLPLLNQKEWYKKTRHGYARGQAPVRYVENVRSYYDILVRLDERENMQQPPSPVLNINSPAL